MSRSLWIVAAFAPLCWIVAAPLAAVDPVAAFITIADSLGRSGDDAALVPHLDEHEILVGAAVAQLLENAFDFAQSGDAESERGAIALAEKIGRIHRDRSGSTVPQDLVTTYRAWTPEQRVTRARAKTLHGQGDTGAKSGDPDTALEQLKQALSLYESIGDRHSLAVVWGSIGVADWYRGDLEAVAADYERALTLRRSVEDHILEGRTLNGLGTVSMRKGDNAAAADYYRQAIELRRRTGDLAGLGTSITYLGHVYFNLRRLVEARDTYEQAYSLLETDGSAAQMIDVLNGIANCYSEMGRVERANETYHRVIEIARTAGDAEREISCLHNLAESYRTSGRYAEALSTLSEAEVVLSERPDSMQTVTHLRIRGLTYMLAGDLDRARDDLVKGGALAKGLPSPDLYIEGLINIGYLYGELGAFDRGLESARQAKQLAEEHGIARKYRDAVVAIGNLYSEQGEYGAALEHWEEALAQDESDGAETMIVEDRLSVASLRAEMGETVEARRAFYQALPTVGETGNVLHTWIAHLGIGHTFETENPDSASFHYEKVLASVERSRAAFRADESRSYFLSGSRRFYFEEIARYYASLDGGASGEWSKRAFVTVERAKARGLLDLLAEAEASHTTQAEEAVLDSLYRLDPAARGHERERDRLKASYERIREERLRGALGGLAAATKPVGIDDIRKVLPPDCVLLQYALGDTASLLWAVDRKGHDLVELPSRSTLLPSVQQLRDAIREHTLGTGNAALRAAARDLYRKLVEPAEKRIEGSSLLVIVPDGFLHEVPFDALLDSDPLPDADWDVQPFLARSHATVYAPSATVYVRLRESKHRGYDLDIIAYGDPDFSLLKDASLHGGPFAPLPFARAELSGIRSTVGRDAKCEIHSGADANERDLKLLLAKQSSRVVHFATHGVTDAVQPEASSIVLCPDPSGAEDGYLQPLEILSMQFRAGLVVLSACGSALGHVSRGEGVVGLSRALIASGSGGVVASLWAVSDESTAELMREFYSSMLGRKQPAVRALQEARLSLIEGKKHAHPFHWSPFIAIGAERAPR